MATKATLTGWSPYVKLYDPLKAGSIDGTDLIPHDNAVVRAMNAEYIPPDERTVKSDPAHTLFVSRLNLRTSEQQLREEFSNFGQVKSCRVVQDIVTGISRGYGFVEFRKEADAQKAWRQAHGSVFHERQILVEWEFSRTMPGWIPRRLGGGLGGRKESGQLRFGGRDRPFKKPFILPSEQKSPCAVSDSEPSLSLMDDAGQYKKTRQNDEKFNYGKSDYGGRSNFTNYSRYSGRKGRDLTESYSEHYDYYGEDRSRYRDNEDESLGNRRTKRKYRWEAEGEYADQSYYEEEPRKYKKMHRDSSSKYINHKKTDRKEIEDRSPSMSYYEEPSSSRKHEAKHRTKYTKDSSRMMESDHGKYSEGKRHSQAAYIQLHGDEIFHSHSAEREKYKERKSNRKEQIDRYNQDPTAFDIATPNPRQSRNDNAGHLETFERKPKKSYSSGTSDSDQASSKRKYKKSKHKKKSHKSDTDCSDNSSGSRLTKKHKKKRKKKKKHRSRSRDKNETD